MKRIKWVSKLNQFVAALLSVMLIAGSMVGPVFGAETGGATESSQAAIDTIGETTGFEDVSDNSNDGSGADANEAVVDELSTENDVSDTADRAAASEGKTEGSAEKEDVPQEYSMDVDDNSEEDLDFEKGITDTNEADVSDYPDHAGDTHDSAGNTDSDDSLSNHMTEDSEQGQPAKNHEEADTAIEETEEIIVPGESQSVKTDASMSLADPSASNFENATIVRSGDSVPVNIQNEGDSAFFAFIPEETGTYTFYSLGNDNGCDPLACLYDGEGTELVSSDDDGEGRNFKILMEFTAGETYYLQAGSYSGEGSYTVSLESRGTKANISLFANGGHFDDWDDDGNYVSGDTMSKGIWLGESLESLGNITVLNEDSNYYLAGWSLVQNGEPIENLSEYYPDGDITLYAVWRKLYFIAFDLNGGYCTESIYDDVIEEWVENATVFRKKVIPGDDIAVYKEEYGPLCSDDSKLFAGWSLVRDGAPIKEENWYTPKESCTLYAVWKNAVKVTFDANGGYFKEDVYDEETGEYVEQSTQIKQYTIPEGSFSSYYDSYESTPESDKGQAFLGWKDEKSGSFIERYDVSDYFNNLYVAEDLTLFAVWQDPVKVTFDANGGHFDGDLNKTSMSIEGFPDELYGEDDIISDPECEGKKFTGWSENADGSKFLGPWLYEYYELYVSEDITLYAVWEDTYTVMLDAGDGSFSDGSHTLSEEVEKGTCYELQIPKAKSGWIFKGWKDVATGNDVLRMVMEVHPGAQAYYLTESSGDLYSTVITEDKSFVAVYEKKEEVQDPDDPDDPVEKYTVVLDANGGTFQTEGGEGEQETAISFSSVYDIDVPDCNGPDGIVLAGWSTTRSGDEMDSWLSSLLSSYYRENGNYPEKVYAIWRYDITLTLKTSEGYFGDVDGTEKEISFGVGDYVELYRQRLHAEEDGRIHTGWIDHATGIIYSAGGYESFTITKNTILEAVWEDAVKLTFRAGENGYYSEGHYPYNDPDEYWFKIAKGDPIGNGGVDRFGQTVRVIEPVNDDNNLTFDAWMTEDGQRIENEELAEYIPGESMVLTAVYKEREIYNITFDANGGSFKQNDRYVDVIETFANKGSEVDFYPSPWEVMNTDTSMILTGWSLDKNGNNIICDSPYYYRCDYVPTSDCTIYAVWHKTYSVTFDFNGGFKSTYNKNETEIFKIPIGSSMKWERDDWSSYHGYYPYDDCVFVGWSLTKDGQVLLQPKDVTEYIPEKDITLFAVYQKSIDLVLDAGKGEFLNDYSERCGRIIFKVPTGTKFFENFSEYEEKMPAVQGSNLVFSYWSDAEGNRIDPYTFILDEDTVLYANYEEGYSIDFYKGEDGYYINWYDNFYNKGFAGSVSQGEAIRFNIRKGDSIKAVHEAVVSGLVNFNDYYQGDPDFYHEGIVYGRKPVLWYTDGELTRRINPETFIPEGDTTLYAGWTSDTFVEDITLDQSNLSLKVDESVSIAASVSPEDATDKDVFWSSSNEKIAKVDKNGKVTGVGAGTATITTTAADGSGIKAECKVTVTAKTISMTDVSAISYNKLNVSWEKCEGADGYMVYRKGNGEAYALVKSLSGEDSTSFTNSVTSGAKYTYKVSAYIMDGKKKIILAQTGEMSGTALPAAPVMKSTGMAAFNKIKVIWTKVSGCAGYVIYRSTEEDGKYSVLKTVTMATATEYSNIVQDGQTYYYKIRAFVEVNGKKVYGDYSEVLSGDVIDAPPANFRLEQRTATKIIFNWDKVEDCEGYVIYRYFPDTNKCKAIKNITSKDTLTYSYKADADTDYQFTMRAFRVVNGKKVYSNYTERISN